MRGAGDILLVSTYELGHQPFALASALGFLERAGYRPVALDLAVDRLDEEAVRRARLVGISVPMHTALRLGLRVAERVRRLNPGAYLVCFGLYGPLLGEQLLGRSQGEEGPGPRERDGWPRFDAVLGGECEAELVALAERLERGERTPPSPAPVLERLAFRAPSRSGLPPLRRYARLAIAGEERVAGYTEASRGCKHHCRHCPIPPVYGGRFFVVPVPVVVEDVRRQVEAGARHVTLGDADFLNGPGHALAVLRALHEAFPETSFDATIKIEHILQQRRHFAEMARLGLLFVVSAVESVSDRVLAILDKGHTRADVVEALAVLRAAGISLRPSLLPFTPWSTLADYLDLLDFIAAHELVDSVDPVHLSIRLLLPPGSLLLEHPEMQPHLEGLDEAALGWRWRHPDPRMDALQRRVAALVEEAARAGEDPRRTFERVRLVAHHAAGHHTPPDLGLPRRQLPPRLTEAWFC